MTSLTFFVCLSWMICCTCAEGCIQSEGEALLEFKAGLEDPASFLSSWIPQGDCCTWFGVVCDGENSTTGHVTELHLGQSSSSFRKNSVFSGKLNPSLLELKHLSYLDLSYNNFEGIPVPSFLCSVTSLNYLYLDGAGFGGVIPHQLGNLSNLQQLGLQAGHYYALYADSLQWISGLHSLEYLDLSSVDLSNASDWLNVINTLPSLSKLYLSRCRIRHIPLIANLNLSSLSALDLYHNDFSQTSVPSWVSSLHSLTYLDLGFNNFGGSFPDELRNLTSLKTLSLYANHFNSSIPNWLYSLHNLEILDLYTNKLSGGISKEIGNLSSIVRLELSLNDGLEFEEGTPELFEGFCSLSSLSLSRVKLNRSVSQLLDTLGKCAYNTLQVLNLRGCQLFGPLTNKIGNFKTLRRLVLANNSISGPLPVLFGGMTSLIHVDIARNKINGTIPESFGMLEELRYADISQNSMQGVVFPQILFAKLSNLSSLYAFDNQLVLKAKPEWRPSKQLVTLDLGSWYVGPGFPHWLQNLEHLNSLDLFNSGISEPFPEWFWNMSSQFYYLNFSHNQIPGRLPHVISVVSSLSLFDFSFNCLEGPLPTISSNLTFLDLSNNLLSGNLLKFLCFNPSRMKDMEYLSLQSNRLTGAIPNCWKHWQNLKAIRLGNNKFSGEIPDSIGYLSSLRALRLQNLSLTGEIPASLGNCSRLVSVGLGQNQLEGNIPKWIGRSLPDLSILSLGWNKFHGSIPGEICNLQSLQILDLSHNYINGTVPECVANLSAMVRAANDTSGIIQVFAGMSYSFPDTQMVVAKGQLLDYSTILNYVRSFDLSSNNLSGEIPKQITSLKALKYLNLSHNSFSGAIPEDLTEMQSLESMDLSNNQLSGAIPSSLGGLTFLSHLNLSCNNLGGKIPSSTQLQSFDSSSFTGNRELCGPPLRVNCSIRSSLVPGFVDDEEFSLHWLSHSVVLGFVAGFWAVVATFALNQESSKIYFEFVDLIGKKLWILLIRSLK